MKAKNQQSIPFYKYHGTGNDFIMIDNRELKVNTDLPDFYEKLCHRRFGIGADGVIFLQNHSEYDFEMIYLNSDGRPTSMCGNGGRCIVAFAHHLGIQTDDKGMYSFLAIDGLHHATIDEKGWVSLQMKDVAALQQVGDVWVLDTGSPHYIQFVEDVSAIDVFKEGRAIRNSERFKKEGINVNFVKAVSDNLQVATYERGVEDETYSCGTGVVAASIASVAYQGLEVGHHTKHIQTKGGKLSVSFEKTLEGHYCNVWLKGPTVRVFEGSFIYHFI